MARFDRRFRARTVAVRLTVVMGVLVALHVISALMYWPESDIDFGFRLRYWHISVFDLDEEASFGTWFSTMMLMFASGLLLMQARARKAAGDWLHPWWRALGLGFGFLSLDEVVGIHEYVNSLTEDIPWTLFGAIVAGFVGLAFLPFLWYQPRRTQVLFVLAGVIYLGGALGVERATDVYSTKEKRQTVDYNLWNTLEEGLEMGGVILFIYALLSHMAGGPRTAVWRTTHVDPSAPSGASGRDPPTAENPSAEK